MLAVFVASCAGPSQPPDLAAVSESSAVSPTTATTGKKMPSVVHKSYKTGAAELDRAGIKYEVLGVDGSPYDVIAFPPDWAITIEEQSVSWNESVPDGTTVQVKLSIREADGKARSSAAAAATASASAEAQRKAEADAAAKAAADKAKNERVVTYVVEADGPIGVITYTNWVDNQMGQEQASDVYGRVSKDYTFKELSFSSSYGLWSLGVSAQAGSETTSITCRILVNGKEISAQTSTGAYSIVSCQKGG